MISKGSDLVSCTSDRFPLPPFTDVSPLIFVLGGRHVSIRRVRAQLGNARDRFLTRETLLPQPAANHGSGSPDTAPREVLAFMKEKIAASQARRGEMIGRAAARLT